MEYDLYLTMSFLPTYRYKKLRIFDALQYVVGLMSSGGC